MKNLLIIVTLFLLPISGLAQEEIKFPELDTKNNAYVLEFTPDKKQENVFSVYKEGETEEEPLHFWANGTDLVQRIMVTVYTPDKNSGIKVAVVKDSWDDSKISGSTKDGIFQESFETAGKFGIVVTSDIPNITFRLAVWTTGEIKPFMGNLYIPVSQNVQGSNNVNNNEAQNESSKDDNTLMYVIIGVLVLIAIFLALLVFKRKPNSTTTIVLLFLIGHQMAEAEIRPSTAEVFSAGLSYFVDNVDNIRSMGQFANDVANQIQRELSPSDSEAIPRPDSSGGPRLPSSCIPRRYGGTQEQSGGISEEDCSCLDDAYLELDGRRFYFEKLRIIYSTTMKSINAKIALADTGSNVHAVSGLAWQNQKMIILSKSIPELNKAYDDKYAQMIRGLEENLRNIEECEANMGNENWYNHAGFMYYQFMVDKYKRE